MPTLCDLMTSLGTHPAPTPTAATATAFVDRPAWRLDWLTPPRCRLILALLLSGGFVLRLLYLGVHPPIDLSGDEAHYWDWSRQLDLSYYSKGPAVAWIIRASCTLFGDTMLAVRLPALLFAVGTSLLTYWLTLKLFASDRLALGAVLLCHAVPMFIAGSMLMTIDPPFYFCWAAATCLAAKALWDERPAFFLLAGAAVGCGFLAKYSALLWYVGLLAALLLRPAWRGWLRRGWVYAGFGVSLAFTAPVVVWNARNGWPTVRHVARQTGATDSLQGLVPRLASFGELVVAQIGVLNPIIAGFMLFACLAAWRGRRDGPIYLMAISLPFLLLVMATSFFKDTPANWPAPTYFGLTILAAWWLGHKVKHFSQWKWVRGWFWAVFGIALLFIPFVHYTFVIYPLLESASGVVRDRPLKVRAIDPTYRLLGWHELGNEVSRQLATLGPDAFVLCEKYDQTAEMAFYVDGQPKTYCLGAWKSDPARRDRFSQYDFWPDRALDAPGLVGRNAIYVGYLSADVTRAFARIEQVPDVRVNRGGAFVRRFLVYRCYGFGGIPRPTDGLTKG